jgi:N-dimethylarginine dimethylaminohydrolase
MYNREILMCRPDFFRIAYQINPYMDLSKQPDHEKLIAEYDAIVEAHKQAGRTVHFMEPVDGLPDMTYTANQALIRGKKAVLANLPKERAGEVLYAREWLVANNYEVIDCPYLFSGQGDALPTGTGAVIKGRGWRSDPKSDDFVAEALGYDIIPIQTTGPEWYDDDLTIGVIKPGLLAVCLDALDEKSQKLLTTHQDLTIIPVSLEEAMRAACNLVSDGTTVIMPTGSPNLAAELEKAGLSVVQKTIEQLWTGGGAVRCTSLALDAS